MWKRRAREVNQHGSMSLRMETRERRKKGVHTQMGFDEPDKKKRSVTCLDENSFEIKLVETTMQLRQNKHG